MSEMIERVALSLFNLDGREDWEPCALAVKEHYRTQARAAIEAMRDPTAAMKAIEGVHWGYGCHVCGGLQEGWQAMIEESLK